MNLAVYMKLEENLDCAVTNIKQKVAEFQTSNRS